MSNKQNGGPDSLPVLTVADTAHHAHDFIALPRDVLCEPPIRHRSENSRTGVTVFELVIVGTLAMLARPVMWQERHRLAEAATDKAHARHRSNIKRAKTRKAAARLGIEDNDDDDLNFFDIGEATGFAEELGEHLTKKQFKEFIRQRFGKIGGAAYWAAHQRYRPKAPFVVKVRRSELLRAAGVESDGGKHFARLQQTLDRLTEPIGAFPPALRRWAQFQNGKLRLEVDPFWVPRGHFGLVPWPPPRGTVELAVYLFAHGCDQRPDSETAAITREKFYRRVGITADRPAHRQRALNRALAATNNHLAQWWPQHRERVLDRLASDPHARAAYGLADAYAVEELPGDGLRIRAVTEREAAERSAAAQPKKAQRPAKRPPPQRQESSMKKSRTARLPRTAAVVTARAELEQQRRYESELAQEQQLKQQTKERAERDERARRAYVRTMAVRPEGADYQWRKIPPGELSIDPEADERLGRVTGRAGAS